MKRAFLLVCGALCLVAPYHRIVAQTVESANPGGAAALGELVAGLGTTTRVLMIGAHPDDEDTQLIAFLAKGRHIETAYLSLTRGDGGQNLIGNELGEALGAIRTQELLAARRIDGGRQYFSRAYDFGFTKTLSESLERWPKDSVLEDAVAIVRAFRPQVIIAVFTGTPADGHGQHQYSGVIAREVFDAAADSVRFPASRMGGLRPWTPLKFYRLRRGANGATLRFDVGEYDPLLGHSYSEIATVSRSQHRSQGQGAMPQRGPRFSGVRLEVSRVSDATARETGLFDGIDTSWARFKSLPLGAGIRSAIDSLPVAEAAVRQSERLTDPSAMVAPLANYLRLVDRASSGVHCAVLEPEPGDAPACNPAEGDLALALSNTRERATQAILDAAGVTVEATAPREIVAERDSLPVTLSVYDQGKMPVSLLGASIANEGREGRGTSPARLIAPDSAAHLGLVYRAGTEPTEPWWLRQPRRGDMFTLTAGPGRVSTEMITGEDRLQDSGVDALLQIDGVSVPVHTGPIVYRYGDRAIGEVRRPIAIVPEITVLLQHEIEYARANVPFDRTVLVSVHSGATSQRTVDVSLSLPEGLSADTAMHQVVVPPLGETTVYFHVRGRLSAGRHEIAATASADGQRFTTGYNLIEYQHIEPQRIYRPARVGVEAVSATFANLRIGYIRGVGDNVMPMLEELGLPVVELDPATLPQTDLSRFTTIVLGTRAYEASPALVAANPLLMRFVRNGGTMVTQYGQNEYERPGILPYPITLARPADRVTDETAPVRVIDPGSPLLSHPNKIGGSDFANWVQERSSYMPSTFDPHYRAVLSMNDPGEHPNDAGILVAPLGKGTYVYTTLSFFRQLPAGNPGAARLFINLLSATPKAADRPAVTSSPVRP